MPQHHRRIEQWATTLEETLDEEDERRRRDANFDPKNLPPCIVNALLDLTHNKRCVHPSAHPKPNTHSSQCRVVIATIYKSVEKQNKPLAVNSLCLPFVPLTTIALNSTTGSLWPMDAQRGGQRQERQTAAPRAVDRTQEQETRAGDHVLQHERPQGAKARMLQLSARWGISRSAFQGASPLPHRSAQEETRSSAHSNGESGATRIRRCRTSSFARQSS